MGQGCDKSFPAVDTSNFCSSAIGEPLLLPNFCSLSGSHDDTRRDYCARIGGGNGEWTFDTAGAFNSCDYDDCNETTERPTGVSNCCRGCCGISGGATAYCKRTAFNGDPLKCCLLDQACVNSTTNPIGFNQACFDDSTQNQTCAPQNRDQTSSDCRSRMLDWCVGTLPDGSREPNDVWTQKWLGPVVVGGQTFDRPCYHAIYRNLYNGQPASCGNFPPVGPPDSTGFLYAQNLIAAMLKRYEDDGGRLEATESVEANGQLTGMISQICTANPALCSKALFRYCATTTTETLARRVSALHWCGCYMPPEQYAKYTDLYQINRECTPTCNMQGVVQLPSDDGTGVKTCQQQSLCVIDDVAINIARSIVGTSGAGVQFSQICSSCGTSTGAGTGSCRCFITGATFQIIDSKLGDVNISQQCGASSQCFSETKVTTGPDAGTIRSIRIPCDLQPGQPNPFEKEQEQAAANRAAAIQRRNIWIAVIFGILIIVIIVLWLLFHPRPVTIESLKIPIPKSGALYGGTSLIGSRSLDDFTQSNTFSPDLGGTLSDGPLHPTAGGFLPLQPELGFSSQSEFRSLS
jgi:hypothetical protein